MVELANELRYLRRLDAAAAEIDRLKANWEQDCANLEMAHREIDRLREQQGTPIDPADIKQFQRIESRSTGAFGHIEVIRRGVVTRIYEERPGIFTFWAGSDFLGGTTYPNRLPYTYTLLEDAPEQPYPREDAA